MYILRGYTMKYINNYEGLYSITEDGQVFSHVSGKFLKHQIVNGYHRVHLKGKVHRVHRLVALAYIANPDNLPQVDHRDDDKNNNHKDNLRWCSNKTNSDWYTNNNRDKHITNSAVGSIPLMLDGYQARSIHEAAKLILDVYPDKKLHTVRKELRRFIKSGRNTACLYGFNISQP